MKCILCDYNKQFNKIATKEEMRWGCWGYNKDILKCPQCGLVFLYPQWTQKELNKLYSNYLLEKDFPGQIQEKRITKYLIKYITKRDKILEIGCGRGENVNYLRNKGYSVWGVEKDPHSQNKYIRNLDYKNLKCNELYDFIYAIQVFEHISNPKDFIDKIQSLLVKNGKFLLEFPNLEEPILSVWKVKEFQKFYNIPHHLYFWNPYTIVLLFFANLNMDVKIIRKQHYGILNHLRWVIFKRPGSWHPHIPIIDGIYKFILEKIIKKTDTLIIIGEKNG